MSRIRELRKALALSQAELAQRLGVHQTAVSQWERDRTAPDIETLARMSRLFGKPIEYIMSCATSPIAQHPDLLKVEGARVTMVSERAVDIASVLDQPYETLTVGGEDLSCDFAMRMIDDSMVGARIQAGDIVLVHAQDDVPDGKIAAVIIDDHVTLRRAYHVPKGIMLVADNPRYSAQVLWLEPRMVHGEKKNVQIIGKADQLISRLR